MNLEDIYNIDTEYRMGKNKGKRGKRTEYARWESIMAKLDNELKKQAAEQKKNADKKPRGKKGNQDAE